jgi:hypothetical protein
MVGIVSERAVDERLARKRVVSGYALEALGEVQAGDVYQITDVIVARHQAKATPREVWQALVELQLKDTHIECKTVDGDLNSNKPARFLWSRQEDLDKSGN